MNSLSFLDKYRGRKIFFTVLNWGLGHASRSIPLIERLITHNEVIIGSDGNSLSLLQKEFPTCKCLSLPEYNIEYGSSSFFFSMLKQSPKVMLAVSKELDATEVIVQKEQIDLVISDHRLGCRSDDCKSIFIGHQLQIKGGLGFFGKVGSKVNKYFINFFDECWIPDYENRQMCLAGELSDTAGIKNASYIGPVSRLKRLKHTNKYDIAVVLSGPEPARTTIDKKLMKILPQLSEKIAFVHGHVKFRPYHSSKITHFGLCSSHEINKILNQSNIVISRSGYSTIMDFELLVKQAILIPTPGQTEQEYLSQHLSERANYQFIKEDQLTESSIKKAIDQLNRFIV